MGMDARKIDVVTTCSKAAMSVYGQRMLDSFMRYWSVYIRLHFYTDFPIDGGPKFNVHSLPQWHRLWKESHVNHAYAHGKDPSRNRANKRDYDFKQDAVRFSHKVAAITDAAAKIDTDVLIWMDADVITHAAVDQQWLLKFLPDDRYISWLDRAHTYPECGFFMLNGAHANHRPLMSELQRVYRSNDIFQLEQTHDSFVIENTIDRFRLGGYIPEPYDLSTPAGRQTGDPFSTSKLAQCLTHLKGAKKNA